MPSDEVHAVVVNDLLCAGTVSWCVCVCLDKTMGCIKSKEDKGPAMKYRPENTPASDPTATTAAAAAHTGHYGPDPTQLQQNQCPSSSSGPVTAAFNHTITPFGGASSAITPFGGASSSFSGSIPNSFPGTVSGKQGLL